MYLSNQTKTVRNRSKVYFNDVSVTESKEISKKSTNEKWTTHIAPTNKTKLVHNDNNDFDPVSDEDLDHGDTLNSDRCEKDKDDEKGIQNSNKTRYEKRPYKI